MVQDFNFDPVDGLKNKNIFPTVPTSEEGLRDQIQTPLDQIKNYINDNLPSLDPDKVKYTLTAVLKPFDSTDGKIADVIKWILYMVKTITGKTSAFEFPNISLNDAISRNGDTIDGDIDISGVLRAFNSFWLKNQTTDAPNYDAAFNISGSYTGDDGQGIMNLVCSEFTINGNKVWHYGEQGSGSGLDADTVDGYHYSSLRPVFGTYIGDGQASRDINLNFKPSAIIVMANGEMMANTYTNGSYTSGFWGGLSFTGSENSVVSLITNGIRVYYNTSTGSYSNTNGRTYKYIAWR